MSRLKLLNDLAINEGTNTRIDGLGFETYAQVLGDAAIGTPGPFTIGVFGEWGTGKTSLMHLTEKYAKHQANGDVITVWFNAWRYEKEEHPIVPLLATIIKELNAKENKSFTENMSDKGREFINALRAVAYGFSAKSKIKMSGLAEIEASFVAKEMIDRAESLSNDPLLDKSIYYEAFERLSKTNINGNKKIVVFIDDLDRCFPNLAIQLLESIKLVLCQSGFIFVLGVARTVIEGYLKHRYKEEFGIENFKGESYLDKIIQLPFYIPPNKERIESFCNSIIRQLDAEDKKVFKSILPIIATTTGGNPRATIRFLNNLLIDRAINNLLVYSEGMEEIPIEFFAITRLIQQQWRGIFSILIDNIELTREMLSWNKSELLEKTHSSKDDDVSTIARMLYSDKLLNELVFSKYGRNWLSNEELRNASIVFLKQRHQEYDPNGDITDPSKLILQYYQLEDEEIAVKFATNLAMNDYEALDVDFYIEGKKKLSEISGDIEKSKGILICIGENFTDKNEKFDMYLQIFKQIETIDRPIIPILLPGSKLNQIPSQLRDYPYINMQNEIRIEKLLRYLYKFDQK